MTDQARDICSNSSTKRLLSELSLPIELSTQQNTATSTTTVTTTTTTSTIVTTTSLHISCPPVTSLTTMGKSKGIGNSNSSNLNNNNNNVNSNNIGSMSAGKRQTSPSTPSSALDFFTFKWLFKKRAVPFLKKSSSSVFPETLSQDNSSSNNNSNNPLGSVAAAGNGVVSESGSIATDVNSKGKAISHYRSNGFIGSRFDFQSIPGTAKPSKICGVTPIISRLTGNSNNCRSTLKMKLSYSFGDIDEFSKWPVLDSGERQLLTSMDGSNHCYQPDQQQHSYSHCNNSHHAKRHNRQSSLASPPTSSSSTSHLISSSCRPSTIDLYQPRRESVGTMVTTGKSCSMNPNQLQANELCYLCLTEIPTPSMHTIWSCGCRFCIDCLSTYLSINIKENNNVTNLSCPDSKCPALLKTKAKRSLTVNNTGRVYSSLLINDCPNKFTPQEIQLLVTDEIFVLYKRYKLYQEVDEDPYRTWCPKPNCDNICVILKPTTVSLPSSASFTSSKSTTSTKMSLTTSTVDQGERSSFFCDKCNETYCTLCRKPYHQSNQCWPSGLPADDDDLALLLNNNQSGSPSRLNNIKRCPRCSVWIERDDGCAQMMCRKCKHVFCWFCLQSLEDDFLLRHYDKGPCKNKLGHSRPSVLWHRTQVIAIFAGFGLLLLLASPLFLIASPCILCCNCCCGSSCKYLDDSDPNEDEDGFGAANL